MSSLRLGMAVLAVVLPASSALAAEQATPAPTQSQTLPVSGQPVGPSAPNVTPSRRDGPGSSSATTSTPPVAGANSFTESQARDRIANSGFSNVQNLKMDNDGIWRGKAQKNGRQVGVALDYRGNVVQQ